MSKEVSAVSRPEGEVKPALPVDVVDGIPDRSSKRGRWIYLLVAIIFCVWVAVLIYIQIAGRPESI